VTVVVIAYGLRDQTLAETGLLEDMGYQVRHLAAIPECKIISRVVAGLDNIDLDAAAERGVLVTNVLTPHSGWYSAEAQQDVIALACDEVQRALSGQPPRSPVNPPVPASATEAAQ
jgi:lactate dehydrogenase-like 2-hydroxyacid dehydrogenase